jgi:response regulator RpfG family c-di-GMP phosphodiesterase
MSIILSDMRMPGMDGATFLERACQIRPNAVRMLLTGHADLDATIKAVNEGQIFKYVSKPCPAKKLIEIFKEAHDEFLRVEAETEILKQTLRGSVQVLTEVLGSINPTAFGCAARVQRIIKQTTADRFPNIWQFELAALLSQIGCVTLPLDTLNKVTAGEELSEEEHDIFSNHPYVAESFLRQIPRLEEISGMVAGQQDPIRYTDTELPLNMQNRVLLGAQLLRAAIDFDHLITGGSTKEEAIEELASQPKEYDHRIVALLHGVDLEATKKLPRYVHA